MYAETLHSMPYVVKACAYYTISVTVTGGCDELYMVCSITIQDRAIYSGSQLYQAQLTLKRVQTTNSCLAVISTV